MKHTNFQQQEIASSAPEKVVEKIVYVDRPVQVELTDKKFKRWMLRGQLVGFVGMLIGVGGTVAAFYLPDKQSTLGLVIVSWFVALIAFGIGAFIASFAKFEAWWHNG